MRSAPILHLMGWTLTVVSLPLLALGLFSIYLESGDFVFIFQAFFGPTIVSAATGIFLIRFFNHRYDQEDGVRDREAVTAVALGWLVVIFFGGMPYWFGGTFTGPLDLIEGNAGFWDVALGLLHSWFESMSGFTTTGATMIDPETSPVCVVGEDCIASQRRSILLWRSLTQWLGGMGVIMLSILILGRWIGGGLSAATAELTGPSLSRLGPKLQHTARILWGIYLLLTLLEWILLFLLTEMDWFDSLNHAFTTMASGGFSTHDAGIMHFDSVKIELIITAFMILTGVNYSLFHISFRGGVKEAFKDEELRIYLGVLFLAWLGMVFSLSSKGDHSLLESARFAMFQTASIGTSTGYASADYALWPSLSLLILMFLMIVGASAGSTSGGLKILRLKIAYEIVRQEIGRIVQPRSVRSIRMNGEVVSLSKVQVVLGMLSAWAVSAVVGTTLIAIFEPNLDLESVLSISLSCLGNTGPALGTYGPTATWASMNPPTMLITTLMMWLGRLEILTVLVVFNPRAWRL